VDAEAFSRITEDRCLLSYQITDLGSLAGDRGESVAYGSSLDLSHQVALYVS
jgi:hypothetical protein